MPRGPKPAKSKEAKLTVTPRSPKDDGARFRDLEKRLEEALKGKTEALKREADALGKLQTRDRELAESQEQQTATAEILSVISSSATDLQLVLDTVAQSAARLCGANDAQIFRVEGDRMRRVAQFGSLPTLDVVPLTRSWVASRSVIDRQVVHVLDRAVEVETEFPEGFEAQRRIEHRTTLAVPLLRERDVIGSIFIARTELRPFTDSQITLLQTFADQAVIAIENVRLFTELQEKNKALTQAHAQVTESLEQQTATSEILRVISSSPTDVQPVFDAVAKSAVRLCEAVDAEVFRRDGDRLLLVAHHGQIPSRSFTIPLVRESFNGRAVLDGRTLHVVDLPSETDEFPRGSEIARQHGSRAQLSAPLMRDGVAIGTISLRRTEARLFTDRQVALLQTFADQAVIAIENVRLFKELEARNKDLTEALDQQTATSEILRVISSSPTDIQPVFDAICRSAVRLCGAYGGLITSFDGTLVHLAAVFSPSPDANERVRREYPRRPDADAARDRAILAREVIQIPDTETDSQYTRQVAREFGYRRLLYVPMLRDGQPIGSIGVSGREPGPYTEQQIELLKTFADQAVIAIENVRLFKELEARNSDLTATSEILQVISRSPTDTQPVFETIADNAMRLFRPWSIAVYRFDGELIHVAAARGGLPGSDQYLREQGPRRPTRDFMAGRCIVDRSVVHVRDFDTDVDVPATAREIARRRGFKATITVPMLRDGEPIGVISVSRTESGGFSQAEIDLLKTFADQAVIAIENVRLFTELEDKNRALIQAHAQVTEALEQQTATSDILRVISSAHVDAQPVFDTIVRSAVRLCRGVFCSLFQFDGELIHHVAHHNFSPEALAEMHRIFPARPTRALLPGRAVLERTISHIPDVLELDPEFPVQAVARTLGIRSGLWVPMLREGAPVGVISVARAEPGPFSDNEIALLKTFADQAVIAIENVRLFKELETRNHDLTDALDQQTATSEILRVISSSPTDVQPVFDAIIQNAARLCGSSNGTVFRFDGNLIQVAAHHNFAPEAADVVNRVFPLPADRGTVTGRAILTRSVVHVADLASDAETHPALLEAGVCAILAVPMFRESVPIGAITVSRRQPEPFSEREISLLQTFADQAVIAIENVRLFKELESRNRDLTEALDQQTATAEVLKVISRSAFDLQAVLTTLLENATRLCGAEWGVIFRPDGEVHRMAVVYGAPAEFSEFLNRTPIPPERGSGVGRAALECRTVQVVDVAADPEYELTEFYRIGGFRTVLAVPMLRDGVLLGVFGLHRNEVRPFTEKQIELVTTFADQGVIAIENARLLSELQARTTELTRSVDELRALGEVGRAVSSTLDLETVLSTIVSRAIQLSGTDGGSVYEYSEATEEFSLRASRDLPEAYVERVRGTRPRKGEGAVGRVAQTREPVQIADISDAAAYESRVRNMLLQIGLRALLAVPLIAEDQLVGALIVMRKRTGTFAAEEVALLQTFATQSALAIQNARLFREIEDKSRQLEAASQHKSEFLANMSHELRTPLNAIIGFSEVLTDRMFGELNEKQEEYLKDIYASGTHLLSLINDILDLSKIEAGRMELELTEFDLPTAIENALMLVRERAGRRSLTLQTNIDDRLGQIQADERKVRQVVLNLLSNAIKFTPEGGRIDVGAMPKDGFVEVSVSDTGIGIAPEDQEKVFEEFRQVGTAAKKIEGTGLGLTLCRKFVELHGGKIWVKSQISQGATFTFMLPIHRGD